MMAPEKIKILYIADSTSVHTQRWIKHFVERGFEIYLITIGKKRQTLPDVHHVANFDLFYYNSPGFLKIMNKTRRIVRSIRPHILHSHFVHQYGWLGAFSGYHPFVLTAWGTDILTLPHVSRIKIGKWLTQYTLKRADTITTTSEAAKRAAILLGADSEKIDVVFWGVDVQKFRPDIETKEIRNSLSIPENAPVVLSNRNYAPLYNTDVIIKSFASVIENYPDAILVLQNAGGGMARESVLKKLAADMGISASVRFLPQYKHTDLPPLYALADVYVSVPSWDAGPVSLKEAMASHCTPIISNVPGPMEWVCHEENGLVVPVRDGFRLTAAMCDLLSDKEKRSRFNKINRELMIKKASHEHQMGKIEALYLKIIKSEQRCVA